MEPADVFGAAPLPDVTDAGRPRRRPSRQPLVLVVEDQAALARLVERVLGEERFRTQLAFDGPTGLEAALGGAPDAIVLDISLPRLDGLGLCRAVRSRGLRMPIIMLTARDAVPDRVAGLEAGADDYVTKPFAFEELIARLRAHLRREGRALGALRVAGLVLDPETHRVIRDGLEVPLSSQEFRLLELLMRHVGQVLTRDRIIEHIWGYDAEPSSNVVDVYMHYLRRKIDRGFDRPLIHTVRSVGYVLRG